MAVHPDAVVEELPEARDLDRPLGRHLHHDPRSLERYSLRDRVRGITPATKVWRRSVRSFDQGRMGSCVGMAVVGLIDTADHDTPQGRRFLEGRAVDAYKLATTIDPFAGSMPPTDTGTDFISGAQAAIRLGYFKGPYWWGRGVGELIRIIVGLGGAAVGIPWPRSFSQPDARGVVHLGGSDIGGHEVEVLGYHHDDSAGAPVSFVGEPLFECPQSWGPFGVRGSAPRTHPPGRFYMPVSAMDDRLRRGGDVGTFSQP